MDQSERLKICGKCKKPKLSISFWEGQKRVHEYWVCGCRNSQNEK